MKQIEGLKFRRQFPILNFIVDFVCLERKLIIEVDGGQHNNILKDQDKERTRILMSKGFQVLRYWNNDVLTQTSSILESIYLYLRSPHLNPPPPWRGRKKEEK